MQHPISIESCQVLKRGFDIWRMRPEGEIPEEKLLSKLNFSRTELGKNLQICLSIINKK